MDALQKTHQEIVKNANSIVEINNELTLLKYQLIYNTQSIHAITDEKSDLKEILAAIERANNLNELRIKSVEDELQDKVYQVS